MAKGIVIRMLCTNPSCRFSEQKLEIKKALNVSPSTGNHSFIVPKACPLCKSGTELLGFVSGEVTIIPDDAKED